MQRQEVSAAAARRGAAGQLLECYAALAADAAHLLDGVVQGRPLVQWEHYPADDVIDRETGYQYFYHCHAPASRTGGPEHGHFHVFARLDAGRHRLDERSEADFLALLGAGARPRHALAHLLAVALTPKGVPSALFTVNQWVTGDRVLSARAAVRALAGFEMRSAGDPLVNRWLAALIGLFRPQIGRLLAARDRRLLAAARARRREPLLEDRAIEVLSSVAIDVDRQLRALEPGRAASAQVRLRNSR